MLTSIEGFYENGEIHLDEIPQIKDKIKIVVTFLSKIEVNPAPKRRLGSLIGKISLPGDFNEPLDDLKDYMF
jgi:hypothetical protein